MMDWLSGWWSGGAAWSSPLPCAMRARLAQLHGKSFHRGWGEGVSLGEEENADQLLNQVARPLMSMAKMPESVE